MGFIPNIPAPWLKAEAAGYFPRWEPDRETTRSASPPPHNPIGCVVFRKMTAVNSLHWSRGRATGRGAEVTSCAEHFLGVAPNHSQPTINRWLLTKVSFLTPSTIFINHSSTCYFTPWFKRIRNSLPTSKAIRISCKEDLGGTAWKLPVWRRKRSNVFCLNCQR